MLSWLRRGETDARITSDVTQKLLDVYALNDARITVQPFIPAEEALCEVAAVTARQNMGNEPDA